MFCQSVTAWESNSHITEWGAQLSFLREQLGVNDKAYFDTSKAKACLEGTRVEILDNARTWIKTIDDDANDSLWVHGKAGSGKSTVSNSVAAIALEENCLLSSFFCKRDDESRSNARKVLPALAYQFARQHDSYRVALMEFFRDGTKSAGVAESMDVSTQLKNLFTDRLASVVDPCKSHGAVVDALDELKPAERRELVKSLLDLAGQAPWIKVFLTSRDDGDIQDILASNPSVRAVDINSATDTDRDIRAYICKQPIVTKLALSDAEIDTLVERSQGLFIYCTTLLSFASQDIEFMTNTRLRSILFSPHQHQALSPLYDLYEQVVQACSTNANVSYFIRDFLSVVYLSSNNRPLSTISIETLLRGLDPFEDRTVEQINSVVNRLLPVLYIDSSSVIRAHHASFYDYIHDRMTSGGGWSTEGSLQQHIARRCVATMNAELRFNMCQIERPVLNKEISDLAERIRENVPEILQYSTLFFSCHLIFTDTPGEAIKQDILHLLSTERVLYWIEVLSLQGALAEGVIALGRIGDIFEATRVSGQNVTMDLKFNAQINLEKNFFSNTKFVQRRFLF